MIDNDQSIKFRTAIPNNGKTLFAIQADSVITGRRAKSSRVANLAAGMLNSRRRHPRIPAIMPNPGQYDGLGPDK